VKNRIRLILMLVLVSLPVLTACAAPPANPATGIVPGDLLTIEAAAEDIIDFAPSGNWDKIGKDVTDIESAWKSYQPQSKQDGAAQEIQNLMSSALAELEAASQSKDASAVMQGSNHVSAAVVELFALYNPVTPVDIGRLDVLERQVILDVQAQDYAAAMKTMEKTRSVWEKVKPSVLGHEGAEVAAQFDASLEAQAAALDDKAADELTRETTNALEIVDDLERLY
jgi:hypothetical protein